MATIVLVHGMGQERESADKLESVWLPALAGGVRKAGYADLADRIWRTSMKSAGVEARMAFYGDRFSRVGAQGDDSGDFSAEEMALAQALAEEWLGRGASRTSDEAVRAVARRELAFLGAAPGVAQGPRAVARSVIGSLARLSWFAPFGMYLAESFVVHSLRQVTRYFGDERLREEVLESVSSLLDGDAVVLIGHSLGSIVAFEAAHRLNRPLPLLVTLGSPLGLHSVVFQRLRPQPPSFPVMVRRWINLADRNDLVAAEPDLTRLFQAGMPPGSSFDGGYTADNGATPHRSDFYLGNVKVGKAVAEALNPRPAM